MSYDRNFQPPLHQLCGAAGSLPAQQNCFWKSSRKGVRLPVLPLRPRDSRGLCMSLFPGAVLSALRALSSTATHTFFDIFKPLAWAHNERPPHALHPLPHGPLHAHLLTHNFYRTQQIRRTPGGVFLCLCSKTRAHQITPATRPRWRTRTLASRLRTTITARGSCLGRASCPWPCFSMPGPRDYTRHHRLPRPTWTPRAHFSGRPTRVRRLPCRHSKNAARGAAGPMCLASSVATAVRP